MTHLLRQGFATTYWHFVVLYLEYPLKKKKLIFHYLFVFLYVELKYLFLKLLLFQLLFCNVYSMFFFIITMITIILIITLSLIGT